MSDGKKKDSIDKLIARNDEESAKNDAHREQVTGFRSEIRQRLDSIDEHLVKVEKLIQTLASGRAPR